MNAAISWIGTWNTRASTLYLLEKALVRLDMATKLARASERRLASSTNRSARSIAAAIARTNRSRKVLDMCIADVERACSLFASARTGAKVTR